MIEFLEMAWDDGGLFAQIRVGRFDANEGEKFLHALKNTLVDDNALLLKRLVSLMWYLPGFLEWQRKRVEEVTGDLASYERFIVEMQNTLEDVLGVPWSL